MSVPSSAVEEGDGSVVEKVTDIHDKQPLASILKTTNIHSTSGREHLEPHNGSQVPPLTTDESEISKTKVEPACEKKNKKRKSMQEKISDKKKRKCTKRNPGNLVLCDEQDTETLLSKENLGVMSFPPTDVMAQLSNNEEKPQRKRVHWADKVQDDAAVLELKQNKKMKIEASGNKKASRCKESVASLQVMDRESFPNVHHKVNIGHGSKDIESIGEEGDDEASGSSTSSDEWAIYTDNSPYCSSNDSNAYASIFEREELWSRNDKLLDALKFRTFASDYIYHRRNRRVGAMQSSSDEDAEPSGSASCYFHEEAGSSLSHHRHRSSRITELDTFSDDSDLPSLVTPDSDSNSESTGQQNSQPEKEKEDLPGDASAKATRSSEDDFASSLQNLFV